MSEIIERLTHVEKLASDNRKLLVIAIVSNLPALLEALSQFIP